MGREVEVDGGGREESKNGGVVGGAAWRARGWVAGEEWALRFTGKENVRRGETEGKGKDENEGLR